MVTPLNVAVPMFLCVCVCGHADPWALGPLRVFENVCVSVMALPLETTAPDIDHSGAEARLTGRSVAGRCDRHVK